MPEHKDPKDFSHIFRRDLHHFRILVIGSANAGKTTILQKVCSAGGRKPIIRGETTSSDLTPSIERGEHDIETQFVYPTAQGFIFHDSRGFEAGTVGELEKVGDFINRLAAETDLRDQLHAIWYCLPTGNDRPLTASEISFFEKDTGHVPVIAIFTKMDAIEKKAFSQLVMQGKTFTEAKEEAPKYARDKFQKEYLDRLEGVPCPPARTVQLRDMHKPEADCDTLIQMTADALDKDTLRLFLMSVLRNNLENSVRYAVINVVIPSVQEALRTGMFPQEAQKSLLQGVLEWFPHTCILADDDTYEWANNAKEAANNIVIHRDQLRKFELESTVVPAPMQACCDILLPFVPSMAGPPPSCNQALRLGAAMVTVVDRSFCVSEETYPAALNTATKHYMESASFPVVMTALDETFSPVESKEIDVARLCSIVLANRLASC